MIKYLESLHLVANFFVTSNGGMELVAMKKFKEGCFMAAKYISLLEASNKNMIEGEIV